MPKKDEKPVEVTQPNPYDGLTTTPQQDTADEDEN